MKKQLINHTNLLFILSIFIGISCTKTENQETKSPSLVDQVMEVHDDAMAKMEAMHALESDIKTYLSSLDSTSAQAEIEMGAERVQALADAEEAMMNWMRNYESPSEETPEEEAKKYLTEQKNSIGEVAQQIDNSLEKGKAFLKGKN